MERMIPREIEKQVVEWLERKEIIAIRGPRQCGKTTFLYRLIELIKEKGTPKNNIHYISFEDDFEKEKFEKNPKDYISFNLGTGRNYFLLDEVQYIKNAGKLLKLIYDSLENIKIIITGSSTLDLNDLGSYLVGRVVLFDMHPFSFGEFLRAKNEKLYRYYQAKRIGFHTEKIKTEEIIFLEDLNKLLKEYITFGGYPAVVLENDIEKKKILLKNLYQTYIEKDIVKVYGSKYKQRIGDLVKCLSSLNASMINYTELSSSISLYDKEVKEILSILEHTYIIKIIKPFHKNLTTELRRNPKVYFVDTGLRNIISDRFDFSDDEYGKLLENYVLNKLRNGKINYWRTTAKAEVDFILNGKIPIESKASAKITRSFRSFIDAYKPKTAFLVNLNSFSEVKINETLVFIVPFALLE